jgi:hypothetical protein
MSDQTAVADAPTALRDVLAPMRTAVDALNTVPRELLEAVQAAGFQATTGTIAFAGRNSAGSAQVQYNNSTGGFSSTWPEWAFESAKAALLAGKRVWVASNGDPFGSNLVFVLILA